MRLPSFAGCVHIYVKTLMRFLIAVDEHPIYPLKRPVDFFIVVECTWVGLFLVTSSSYICRSLPDAAPSRDPQKSALGAIADNCYLPKK